MTRRARFHLRRLSAGEGEHETEIPAERGVT